MMRELHCHLSGVDGRTPSEGIAQIDWDFQRPGAEDHAAGAGRLDRVPAKLRGDPV